MHPHDFLEEICEIDIFFSFSYKLKYELVVADQFSHGKLAKATGMTIQPKTFHIFTNLQ